MLILGALDDMSPDDPVIEDFSRIDPLNEFLQELTPLDLYRWLLDYLDSSLFLLVLFLLLGLGIRPIRNSVVILNALLIYLYLRLFSFLCSRSFCLLRFRFFYLLLISSLHAFVSH